MAKKSEIEKIADRYYIKHVCFQCDSYCNCKNLKYIGKCVSAFEGKRAIVGFVDYIAHGNPEITHQISTIFKNK
jgi:hypothetical protein